MRKKTFYLLSLINLLILMTADTFIYAENLEKGSEASIKFEMNTGPTQPVNPDDPETPSNELPQSGQLAIIYANNFDFGSVKISPMKMFYNIETTRPNIQIVDLRGTGTGWTLDVSVSEFKGTSEGDLDPPFLKGSILHIKKGRLNSLTSMDHAPDVVPDIALSTDNFPKRIITAGTDKGQGLWINRFYPQTTDEEAYVQLEVPAGVAMTNTYTATITWILSDIP